MAGASEAARNLISPKARYLIQSILPTSPKFFTDYKTEELKDHTSCEAPLTLLAIDPTDKVLKALPLFGTQSEAVNEAHTGYKSALNEIVGQIRGDEKRAADGVVKYNAEVSEEVKSILEAMEKALAALGKDKANAGVLENEGSEQALPEFPVVRDEEVFPTANGKIFGEIPAERTLASKATTATTVKKTTEDNLKGVKSHRHSMWSDMVSKFTNLHDMLSVAHGRLKLSIGETGSAFDGYTKLTHDESGENLRFDKEIQDSSKAVETDLSELGEDIARVISGVPSTKSGEGELTFFNRLTTTLSVLYIRKAGIKDAKESTAQLKKDINAAKQKLAESIVKRVGEIKEVLDVIKTLAYVEAVKLPGVALDDGVEFNYVGALEKAVDGQNSIDELLPTINMVVNSAWRAHAHMFGFVDIVNENLKAGDDNGQGIAADALKAATGAAECILYGRVDAMFVGLKLDGGDEAKLCGEVHAKGIEKMTDVNGPPDMQAMEKALNDIHDKKLEELELIRSMKAGTDSVKIRQIGNRGLPERSEDKKFKPKRIPKVEGIRNSKEGRSTELGGPTISKPKTSSQPRRNSEKETVNIAGEDMQMIQVDEGDAKTTLNKNDETSENP